MWHNQIVQNQILATQADGFPQLDLDLQLCFPLYAVSRAITTRYGKLLGEVGLTYPQYLVMLALWDAGGANLGTGPGSVHQPRRTMTVGELGERLRLDSGTLSPLLKRLQATGLVDRERDPEDERRVLVQPTRAGWDLRARVAHVPAEIAAAMGLDPGAYVDLKRRLADMLCSLDLQPSAAPARPEASDRG